MARARRRSVVHGAGITAAGALALLLVGVAAGGTSHGSALRTNVVVTDKAIKVSRRTMLEGVVTFVATNRGRKPHAFAIKGPSLDVRTPKLARGKSARLTVLLRPGRYALWDPVALGKKKRKVLLVTAPPKVVAPSTITPPPRFTTPGVDFDCEKDLEDMHCA